MKQKTRAWLLALSMLGEAGAAGGEAETFRCQQADGGINFQATPCSMAELVTPEPPPATAARPDMPPQAKPEPAAVGAKPPPVPPARAERSASTPGPVLLPAPSARHDAAADDDFVKPTRRKREILEVSAQLERCRADAPGFAEKSAAVYDAWTRRHGAVLSEYHKQLVAKVRAGRRGEMTLPLRMCTDEWLQEIEPLSRMPDARFQTVEKTWQLFLGALMTGDRAALLNCLSGPAEARWKLRAEKLSDEDLRRIAGNIRGLKVQWGDDYEKDGLVADNDDRVTGIAFHNINEEWKITELGTASTMAAPAVPFNATSAAVTAPPAAPVVTVPVKSE